MSMITFRFGNWHVTRLTRGNNILDLVLTTEETIVSKVVVGQDFATNDHQMVSSAINLGIGKQKQFLERRKVLRETITWQEDDYRNRFGEGDNRKRHRGKLEHSYQMYVQSHRIDHTKIEENK